MRLLILFLALGAWLGAASSAGADHAPRPASFRAIARQHVQAQAEAQGVPLQLMAVGAPEKSYFQSPGGLVPCWRILVTYRGPQQTHRDSVIVIGERVLGTAISP